MYLNAEEIEVNQEGNWSRVHTWIDLAVVGGGHVASSGIVARVTGGENNLGYQYYGPGSHRLVDGYYYVSHDANGNASTHVDGSFESAIGNWYLSGDLGLSHIDMSISQITSYDFGPTVKDKFVVNYTATSGKEKRLRVSIPNVVMLQTFNNYSSGQTVYLSDSAIALIKQHTNNPSVPIGIVIETWIGNSKIGETSEYIRQLSVGGTVRIGINGQLKESTPYVGVNGQWKEIIPYIGVNGQWKEGI